MKKELLFGFITSIIVMGSIGCAPTFSELQSARTVGKSNVEILPSASKTSFTNTSSNSEMQTHLGVQGAYGFTNFFDFRVRYERISLSNSYSFPGLTYDKTFNIIAFGPKVSLVKNRIAFYLPFGRALGDNYNNSWETQPTLFLTQPIAANKLEVTFSPKFVAQLEKGSTNMYAFNIGLSFSNDLTTWAIRPEYGRLYSVDKNNTGYYSHLSIGFMYIIKGKNNLDNIKPSKHLPSKAN